MHAKPQQKLPPPTRGSTRDAGQIVSDVFASPAHAGIDPCTRRRNSPEKSFPRPRGDRPGPLKTKPPSTPLPPPTRGSTLPGPYDFIRVLASPAHAGSDPDRRGAQPGYSRFPRPRGDRPGQIEFLGRSAELPPPTRGSTLILRQCTSYIRASPAHAGIDPLGLLASLGGFCFPRPRGDRPPQPRRAMCRHTLPPPTRGSTHGIG